MAGPSPVTLYTTGPSCMRCTATKRDLTKAGIEFKERDVTRDPEAAAAAKELGYIEAPVVVISPDRHWSGHRPTLIAEYADELHAAAAHELTAICAPNPQAIAAAAPVATTEPARRPAVMATAALTR